MISISYFVDLDKLILILKFRWRGKRPRIAKVKKKEKNEEEEEGKVGGITILNFLTFCKSTIIKKHDIGKRIARKST